MTTTPTALLPDELLRMLELARQSDSVELKLTVPPHAYRSAAKALALDPLEAQIRQVYFFDTPDLALNRAGVVVRARRVQGRDSDSTVKLRPLVPSELDPSLRSSPQFNVEVDAMPGGYICSGSMKNTLSPTAVLPSVSGERPLRKLFSKEQRAFYSVHAPDGLELDDLAVLGPILVLKLKFDPTDITQRIVVEQWIYPDGSRVVELSTKCAPASALDVAITTRTYLESKGIPVGGEQQTKTKTALEFFAAELASA
ncbi:hypothetical protein [Nocardioides sp. CER19]|uniref:hypothetical protein n=1 Tax=Nocardioides sp. CER19 TaxID=3038538 RepID=UPI00244D4585|nr:hypothetical protein [Nocardioides sp. CER19]MDH2413977.1 hypothetical protein [Nocardioides sp. CER19]